MGPQRLLTPHLPAHACMHVPPSCRDYPALPADAKPLERFVGNTNSLGQLLSEDQQEALMQVQRGGGSAGSGWLLRGKHCAS